MPKNIVLCFDGTDNSVDGDCTNVMRLFRSLERSPRQLTYYDPGVGTLSDPSSTTRTGRFFSRLLDSALGHSLRDNFCEAYRFLVRYYEPGDDIFLFGFSRGAYTARAVAAGLHAFGLVRPEHENMTPYVWSLLLNEPGLDRGGFFEAPARFKKIFTSGDVPIHFVGVWDTVSSLGWIWDFRSVPYTSNNPSVRRVRHAVSIDERRAFFRSNLYCYSGKQDASGKRTLTVPVPGQDLKEVWFPGVHSDVGGGYPDDEGGLSKLALDWMIREAQSPYPITDPQGLQPPRQAPLLIDAAEAARWLGAAGKLTKPDALAMLHQSLTKRWWAGEILPRRSWNSQTDKKSWRGFNLAKRRSIAPGSTIHQSVQTRLAGPAANYKPKNLPPLDQLTIEV